MKKPAFVALWVVCLLGCDGMDEGGPEWRYYVRNDTTVVVSLYAMSADTTIQFPDIPPAAAVLVGSLGPFHPNHTEFFLSDSVLVKHGDTVLDTYCPWDSTRARHIMVRSHYDLTRETDAYMDYTFRLFGYD